MSPSPVDDHDRHDDLDEQDRIALRQLTTLTPSERLEAFIAECRLARQVSQAVPAHESVLGAHPPDAGRATAG